MQGFSALEAEFDGKGLFAGTAVAGDVADVVDVKHGGGEQTAAGGGQEQGRVPAAALQVVAAEDAKQAEEGEDADFAEGMIAVGAAANGVGDGGGDGKRAEAEEDEEAAPVKRADAE